MQHSSTRLYGFFLNLIIFCVHLVFRQKNRVLFICYKKPWGGNCRALCDAAIINNRVKSVTILNMGTTPDSVIRDIYKAAADKTAVFSYADRFSPRFLKALVLADIVFNHEHERHGLRHFSVDLWHGIPLKRIGVLSKAVTYKRIPFFPRRRISYKKVLNRKKCDRLIASSYTDALVMAASFSMPVHKIYVSGLPRNDWVSPAGSLPADYKIEEERIKKLLAGRKLALYAPTFRDDDRSRSPMSEADMRNISAMLEERGYVFGVRPHVTKQSAFFEESADILDFSAGEFPEIQIILRCTDILITDYSSCALDFMLTGRPAVSFAPDIEQYGRGFIYPFEHVFPGIVTRDFDTLQACVKKLAEGDADTVNACHQASARVTPLFHQDNAGGAISARLLNMILDERELYIN